MRLIRAGFEESQSIYISHGHGRSLGQGSRVFFRTLPGHLQTGLWQGLTNCDHALMTDIGNDLVYGHSVDRILGWVQDCAGRLRSLGAEITITGLPLASVKDLSATRFRIFKTAFFPSHPLSLDTLYSRVVQLDEGIRKIAAATGAQFVAPERDWYGFDPIHVRRTRRADAWSEMLSHWSAWDPKPAATARSSLVLRMRLRALPPETRQIFGRQIVRDRTLRFSDGSLIRFF